MHRVILASLAIVLLRDCDLAGPRPSPGKVAGTWGGDGAGLIADDTSAHVHIGCTYGNVHQPIVADSRGRFDLPGEQDITAHPWIGESSTPPASAGRSSGKPLPLR